MPWPGRRHYRTVSLRSQNVTASHVPGKTGVSALVRHSPSAILTPEPLFDMRLSCEDHVGELDKRISKARGPAGIPPAHRLVCVHSRPVRCLSRAAFDLRSGHHAEPGHRSHPPRSERDHPKPGQNGSAPFAGATHRRSSDRQPPACAGEQFHQSPSIEFGRSAAAALLDLAGRRQ